MKKSKSAAGSRSAVHFGDWLKVKAPGESSKKEVVHEGLYGAHFRVSDAACSGVRLDRGIQKEVTERGATR